MSKWIGYGVSVTCGEPLGCYQGTIAAADGGTLTLIKAFRNGYPYPNSQVTLSASDIRELKIIESCGEGADRSDSVVVRTRKPPRPRHTVCESLRAAPPHDRVAPAPAPLPAPVPAPVTASAGRGRRKQDRWLAETDARDPALLHDFDFQTNLALFRKLPAPDLVPAGPPAPPAPPPRLYSVREPPEALYVTDDGALAPSVSDATRRLLRAACERAGVASSMDLLLGRAAADLALRMVGAARRARPARVLALAGAEGAGGGGVAVTHAARLLLAAGARVRLRGGEGEAARLYRLAGGEPADGEEEGEAPDLVLVSGAECPPWWCGRCQVLRVEGRAGGEADGARVACLWALPVPAAPSGPRAPAPDRARLHAAHTAPPPALLHALGIGDIVSCASLLALHPAPPASPPACAMPD